MRASTTSSHANFDVDYASVSTHTDASSNSSRRVASAVATRNSRSTGRLTTDAAWCQREQEHAGVGIARDAYHRRRQVHRCIRSLHAEHKSL